MQHWTRAFAAIALFAAFAALAGLAPAWTMAATAMFWLFAALAALSLLTGAFGRGRDGLYSAERAVTLTGLGCAAAFGGYLWLTEPAWIARFAGG